MKSDNTTAKQLQQQIAKGNQTAFETLYRLYFPRLIKFALLFVHSKEAAEEIVNDVMVKLWEKRYVTPEIENLETYLFIAIRNHSLNYLKKYSHLRILPMPGTREWELQNTSNPAHDLEWKELKARFEAAVTQLPTQCRTIFKLIKEEGFRYKQVAEILGLSPRTVEVQLFRAIKKLNEEFAVYLEYKSKRRGHKGNSYVPLLLLIILHSFFS